MEDFIRLLKTLSEARSPSGLEDEVREVVNAATLLRHVIEKTPPPVVDKFLERRIK
jgi:hypothetical protein